MAEVDVCVCFEPLTNGQPLYVGVNDGMNSCRHVLHVDCWIRRIEMADTRSDTSRDGVYERVYPSCPYCRFEVTALYPWNQAGTIRLVAVTWGYNDSRTTDEVRIIDMSEKVAAFNCPTVPSIDLPAHTKSGEETEGGEIVTASGGRNRDLGMTAGSDVDAIVTVPSAVESTSNITGNKGQESGEDSSVAVAVTTTLPTTTTTTVAHRVTSSSTIIGRPISTASTGSSISNPATGQRALHPAINLAHNMRINRANMRNKFTCPWCGLLFGRTEYMRRHQRTCVFAVDL